MQHEWYDVERSNSDVAGQNTSLDTGPTMLLPAVQLGVPQRLTIGRGCAELARF